MVDSHLINSNNFQDIKKISKKLELWGFRFYILTDSENEMLSLKQLALKNCMFIMKFQLNELRMEKLFLHIEHSLQIVIYETDEFHRMILKN